MNTILYDPDQPKNVRIKSLSSTLLLWILPTLTGVLGLVFLAIALAMRHALKPTTTL